jgi:hypothetical protein
VTEVPQARFGSPYATYEIENPLSSDSRKIAANNKANLSPGMTVPVFYETFSGALCAPAPLQSAARRPLHSKKPWMVPSIAS